MSARPLLPGEPEVQSLAPRSHALEQSERLLLEHLALRVDTAHELYRAFGDVDR